MSDTDQKQEDDVLRRMLATPPTPHKPLSREERSAKKSSEKPSVDLQASDRAVDERVRQNIKDQGA